MPQCEPTDPATHRTFLVRFYTSDSEGRQVGPDTGVRLFDSLDLLIFMCSPRTRSSTALGRIARRAEA